MNFATLRHTWLVVVLFGTVAILGACGDDKKSSESSSTPVAQFKLAEPCEGTGAFVAPITNVAAGAAPICQEIYRCIDGQWQAAGTTCASE